MTITRKALIWSLETLESNTILGNTREPVTENMFSDPSSQAAHTTFLSRKMKNIQCDISFQQHFKGTTGIAFKFKAHCPIFTVFFSLSMLFMYHIQTFKHFEIRKRSSYLKIMINFFLFKKKIQGKKLIFTLIVIFIH